MKFLKTIKMALAFFVAMSIAQFFSFQYATSAGIVGILTIQNTKKETLFICLKRILSFFVSLLSALIVFSVFGYSAMSFAFFLLIFVGISLIFHLEDGIAMNAVITTHYLIEQSMSIQWIQNEMAIFAIGMSIGMLVNLYMPSQQKQIRHSLQKLDIQIKNILMQMSGCLLQEKKTGRLYEVFQEVSLTLDKMFQSVYDEMNNQLLKDTKYEFEYLSMRKEQIIVLKDIYDLMIQIEFHGKQVIFISDFLKHMAVEYHEDNDVHALQQRLMDLKRKFQQDALPQSRDEFENRAILFTMFTYLQKFLELKYQFFIKNRGEEQ